MLAIRHALYSLLAHGPRRVLSEYRNAGPRAKGHRDLTITRIPIVALVMSDEDRKVLSHISDHEPVEIHFAESRVEAWDVLNRLNSPLILYDRDWPDAEWRTTVQTFAASPHRSCVILASRVADDYLWQELIRCGGYDLGRQTVSGRRCCPRTQIGFVLLEKRKGSGETIGGGECGCLSG